MGDTLSFNAVAGTPPSIESLSIGELQIDASYQRSIETPASRKLIEDIACNWDWDKFDPIRVSRRENGLFVVDGQHRLAAAGLRGDILHLPAIVSRFKDTTTEARFFVAVNTTRKTPTPLDKFRARVIAGEEEAVAIDKLINAAGLKIARTPKIREQEIGCVSILGRLYRRYGEIVLGGALGALSKAYPGKGLRAADEMLPGACAFLREPPKPFEAARFIEALQLRDQTAWFMKYSAYRQGNPDACYIEDVFCAFYREAYKTADDRHWDSLERQVKAEPVAKQVSTASPRPIRPPPPVPATPKSVDADEAAIAKFIAEKGITKVPAKTPFLEERLEQAVVKLRAAGNKVTRFGPGWKLDGVSCAVSELLQRAGDPIL